MSALRNSNILLHGWLLPADPTWDSPPCRLALVSKQAGSRCSLLVCMHAYNEKRKRDRTLSWRGLQQCLDGRLPVCGLVPSIGWCLMASFLGGVSSNAWMVGCPDVAWWLWEPSIGRGLMDAWWLWEPSIGRGLMDVWWLWEPSIGRGLMDAHTY